MRLQECKDIAERRQVYGDYISNRINNPVISKFVRFVLDNYVDDKFFSAPASSTGKYHPPHSLGDGGLVRHTVVAADIARELCPLHMVDDEDNRDLIVAATFLHDCWKGVKVFGEKWGRWTSEQHGQVGAKAIVAAYEDYINQGNEFSADWAARIAGYMQNHMTRWITLNKQPQPRPLPEMHHDAQVVASADYISSRKKLLRWVV